jgi:trans-aconitate 2-methyltransferase
MPTWDPKQYLQFESERTQPCIDLVARIPELTARVAVDLGCGPGNSTRVLARRFPQARLIGIDNSKAMIQRAAEALPAVEFHQADAATWTADEPCDVIFSNAAFQWIEKHEVLLPHLMQQLAPGGVLAVQMPRNFQSPTHQILRELALSQRWSNKLAAREPYWVQEPAFYYDVLAPITSRVELWETEYIHILPDSDAIVEWYKGTGLRPYLDALSPAEQSEFLAAYRARLEEAYPRQPDGRVLFPFLRIFFIAVR